MQEVALLSVQRKEYVHITNEWKTMLSCLGTLSVSKQRVKTYYKKKAKGKTTSSESGLRLINKIEGKGKVLLNETSRVGRDKNGWYV